MWVESIRVGSVQTGGECGLNPVTVDFTSHGTPVAVAAGNLWLVCSMGCNVNVANRTNHKFPAATPTGVPCEVKSTVLSILVPLKNLCPVPGKFMAGAVGRCTLQPMARTNHKLPGYGGLGI